MTYRQESFLAPGTWTWPGTVGSVEVYLVGGGGGGNRYPLGAPVPAFGSAPGGGGGIRKATVPVAAPVSVTVGAGGGSAAAGGSSSFGPISVGGGGAGTGNAPADGGGAGAGGPGTPHLLPGDYGVIVKRRLASGGAIHGLFFDDPGTANGDEDHFGMATGWWGSTSANTGAGGVGSPTLPAPSGQSGIVIVRWFE